MNVSAGIVAFIVTCLSLQGCRRVSLVESRSPDGKATIIIDETPGPMEGVLQVDLRRERRTTTLFRGKSEFLLGSTDVAWAADSSKVAIYTCNSLAGHEVIGYDLRRQETLDSTVARSMVEARLRARFGEQIRGPDALQWMCSSEGNLLFSSRFDPTLHPASPVVLPY